MSYSLFSRFFHDTLTPSESAASFFFVCTTETSLHTLHQLILRQQQLTVLSLKTNVPMQQ